MTTVACLDLDRTLIYSANALDLRVPDAQAPRLLCVELYKGMPLSFMTEESAAELEKLGALATVVPTTTRTPEQYARVHLPGPAPRYAITSNGAHLLVDGVPDPAWTAAVHERLAGCAPLPQVRARLEAMSGPFVLTLRTAGLESGPGFVYAVVDRAALPAGWVAELADWCAPHGWRVSLQGRKVYAVPVPLTKSAAAREVLARCGGDRLLAAGDSLLDADLLEAADAAVRPAHGELADTGWTRPHVAVTAARGGWAGAEILGWLREHSAPPMAG
ncbi:HAD family hydrolase [Pseudonocardia sp. CA-107938]|uniref:HAD family hydrolase n=1 Tax=Pseudonocardia sp. CA-107938 TaxID=3240021 RepID=UPI003D8B96BE